MTVFYHLSDEWVEEQLTVSPRVGRTDSDDSRDQVPFIAVCPTIEQCVVAIGEWIDYPTLAVYVCDVDDATLASWVFDVGLTSEHRVYVPTKFTKLGIINTQELQNRVGYSPMSGLSDAVLLQNIARTLHQLRFTNAVASLMSEVCE